MEMNLRKRQRAHHFVRPLTRWSHLPLEEAAGEVVFDCLERETRKSTKIRLL